MESSAFLENIFATLPQELPSHTPTSAPFKERAAKARKEVERLFPVDSKESVHFPPFGDISFPYHNMGNVDSRNLFDLNELVIFSFYWRNRNRYTSVVDLGANIGLHSIILCRCGFKVSSYEPDPVHFDILKKNLARNGCNSASLHNSAVSSRSGSADFTRVLGNTTGSHLSGAKHDVYGDREMFSVELEAFGPILAGADLIKMDVEGHEKEVLLSTEASDWESCDGLVEVGTAENAKHIFKHFTGSGVNLFSQKIGWGLVTKAGDMPESYRDGTLFISVKEQMPW